MKLLFDLFPLLIFFGAFKMYDIYTATAAAIIATFVQVGVFWFKHRRFETMHLVTLVIISVFGGLTIFFQDDAFIKWKPSIVNWVFSIVIFVMLFTKKTALEYVMGGQLTLPKSIWQKLNLSWAIFFLVLGLINVYVAFYYNLDADAETRTQTWVNFKVFGLMGITLAFTIAQMFFLSKHIDVDAIGKPKTAQKTED
ncbi:MAG: septation protein A [Gammaproteobacteria bacterium]|nr:septation protein A [Gammaproteobacteria bacterium]